MNAGANQLVVGSGSTGQGITLYSSTSTGGSIHFADGTSGNEAYRGQLVYNHNGDYMAMYTAATERLRIDSSGNVGIGTTPAAKLHATGTFGTTLTSGIRLDGLGATTNNLAPIAFYTQSSNWGTQHAANIAAAQADGTDGGAYLRFSTSPDGNTAPTERLRIDSSGNVILAAGTGTLQTATAGTSNLRLGVNAGNSIASGGNYNTVVGDEAGTAITTGDENVAVGFNSLAAIDTGIHNVSVGSRALQADVKGNYSTAIGKNALTAQSFASATDAYNTAVGYAAGAAVTTGTNNTLIGGLAGDAITTGGDNVAVGYNSLGVNTTGTFNTAFGKGAGSAITTGGSNVCIGGDAGLATNLTTGSENTLIGQYCHPSVGSATNANGFGYDINAEGGYTTVGRAADDIRAAHGVATWATVSDERYKKDIVDSTTGLSFINALRPRTFKYRTLGELPETFRAYEADSTEVFKNSKTNHGFIAQEIKAAIDADASIKDGFRLWDDREDGSQEVAEAALIPVLVKAIQELTARLETLEGK
jgi:trimeric autotransporter adhesin